MSKSSDRTNASLDQDVSADQVAPRLTLTRERVKALRVQTGCKTGLFNFVGPVILTQNTIYRCQ